MNERVLITGASRGIGAAIARACSRLGYEVIGTALPGETIEESIDGVTYLRLNLNDDASIATCAKEAGAVDVLINNAGVSQIGPVEETPVDNYRSLFQTNVVGAIQMTQAVLPSMRERRKGVIINIGSMAGRFAVPFQSGYVASKFAATGWTWSLRNEVRRFGIKVIVIEPNDIRTTIEPAYFVNPKSEYSSDIQKVKGVRDANMAHAPGPEVVAEKVVKILRKKRPAPIYVVGGMGPMMAFAKRLLPDKVVETLVRRTYGMK